MRYTKIICFAFMAIAILILLVPFLIEVIPPASERFESVHATSTVAPMMGFQENSVFNIGDTNVLDKFPGVGEVIAQRIIEGRTILNGYRIPEDLMLVKGIGEKTLEKIMDALEEPLVELLPLEE